MPKVAVIVLTFNSVSKLGAYFRRAMDSIFVQGGDFEVIFVDNGSRDATPQALREICASGRRPCRALFLSRNLGWSAANNRAALAAKDAEYLFFLNDDVILEGGALERLVKFLEGDRRVGALQPAIVNRDGTKHYGLDLVPGGMCFVVRRARGYPFSEAFSASGAALLTPSAAFFRSGMFPERFFLYYDDVDFCWRLRRLGYRAGALVTARCYHYGSATFGSRSPAFFYYETRNRIWSLRRNLPGHRLPQGLALAVFSTLLYYVAYEVLARRNRGAIGASFRGLLHGLRGEAT